eukprot:TRINITY_DN5054_c0_g1_i1.p1 TRINITY_DN5054_c0_g1~~TRINITY_DN5054_c0_g1_i1.p1  ORF type:complete len:1361 (-),score=133.33 TRINITY_DN5054_c0_g1_i1:1116-5165(-)
MVCDRVHAWLVALLFCHEIGLCSATEPELGLTCSGLNALHFANSTLRDSHVGKHLCAFPAVTSAPRLFCHSLAREDTDHFRLVCTETSYPVVPVLGIGCSLAGKLDYWLGVCTLLNHRAMWTSQANATDTDMQLIIFSVQQQVRIAAALQDISLGWRVTLTNESLSYLQQLVLVTPWRLFRLSATALPEDLSRLRRLLLSRPAPGTYAVYSARDTTLWQTVWRVLIPLSCAAALCSTVTWRFFRKTSPPMPLFSWFLSTVWLAISLTSMVCGFGAFVVFVLMQRRVAINDALLKEFLPVWGFASPVCILLSAAILVRRKSLDFADLVRPHARLIAWQFRVVFLITLVQVGRATYAASTSTTGSYFLLWVILLTEGGIQCIQITLGYCFCVRPRLDQGSDLTAEAAPSGASLELRLFCIGCEVSVVCPTATISCVARLGRVRLHMNPAVLGVHSVALRSAFSCTSDPFYWRVIPGCPYIDKFALRCMPEYCDVGHAVAVEVVARDECGNIINFDSPVVHSLLAGLTLGPQQSQGTAGELQTTPITPLTFAFREGVFRASFVPTSVGMFQFALGSCKTHVLVFPTLLNASFECPEFAQTDPFRIAVGTPVKFTVQIIDTSGLILPLAASLRVTVYPERQCSLCGNAIPRSRLPFTVVNQDGRPADVAAVPSTPVGQCASDCDPAIHVSMQCVDDTLHATGSIGTMPTRSAPTLVTSCTPVESAHANPQNVPPGCTCDGLPWQDETAIIPQDNGECTFTPQFIGRYCVAVGFGGFPEALEEQSRAIRRIWNSAIESVGESHVRLERTVVHVAERVAVGTSVCIALEFFNILGERQTELGSCEALVITPKIASEDSTVSYPAEDVTPITLTSVAWRPTRAGKYSITIQVLARELDPALCTITGQQGLIWTFLSAGWWQTSMSCEVLPGPTVGCYVRPAALHPTETMSESTPVHRLLTVVGTRKSSTPPLLIVTHDAHQNTTSDGNDHVILRLQLRSGNTACNWHPYALVGQTYHPLSISWQPPEGEYDVCVVVNNSLISTDIVLVVTHAPGFSIRAKDCSWLTGCHEDQSSWLRSAVALHVQSSARISAEVPHHGEYAGTALKRLYLLPTAAHPFPLEVSTTAAARLPLVVFHGTTPTSVQTILRHGLRAQLSATALFGQGTYFADIVTKALLHVDKHNRYPNRQSRFVLVCEADLNDCQVVDGGTCYDQRPKSSGTARVIAAHGKYYLDNYACDSQRAVMVGMPKVRRDGETFWLGDVALQLNEYVCRVPSSYRLLGVAQISTAGPKVARMRPSPPLVGMNVNAVSHNSTRGEDSSSDLATLFEGGRPRALVSTARTTITVPTFARCQELLY